MASLDTEKADRRVWLVKVPPYIAEQWKAAIQRGAGGMDDDEGDGGASLGKITLVPLPEGGNQTVLELPEGMGDASVPRRYTLQQGTDVLDMSVLSSDADAGGGSGGGADEQPRLVKPRLDGIVSQKFDVVPTQAPLRQGQGAAGGAPAIDETYRSLNRKRTLASLQKGRSVAVIDNVTQARSLYHAQHGQTSLYQKQTLAAKEAAEAQARSARELRAAGAAGARRVRMERAELEQALFKLFEKQAAWSFQQLQKETDQPAAYLREVLGEIAAPSRRGPARDTWELQQRFKVPAGGGGA